MDLKTVLNKRLEELGMTQYELAIAYGKKQNPKPEPDLTDRDIGNKYLSTVRKALSNPETCKPATLRGVVEALNGQLTMQIEFFDTKTYKLST